jgi:hypothetical protein
MVGRQKTKNEFKATVESMLEAGGAHLLVLPGGYGLGKTFFLLKAKELVSDQKIITKKAIASFVKALPYKPPNKYYVYLWSKIAEDLRIESFRLLRKEITKAAQQKSASEDSFLDSLEQSFRNAMLKIGGADEQQAFNWLKCVKLSAKMKERLGISYNIDSDDSAESVLNEFLKLLKLIGYSGLVILVDEFEYVFTVGKARSIQFVVAYKLLRDKANERLSVRHDLAGLVFVLACSPGVWEKLVEFSKEYEVEKGGPGLAPFMERVRILPELETLTDHETEELIATRLNQARIPGSRVDPLHPFTNKYPHYIREKSSGRPRGIISYSSYVIEDALKLGQSEASDDLADKILREHGLILDLSVTAQRPEEFPRVRGKSRVEEVERRIE